MQLPTLSPTVWSDSSSTLAPEALLLGGWHTHWAHHHSPATPGNILLMCMHPPPSPARSCCIWTHPSVPAIPAPGAVWPTTGPKGHPSGWLVHPLSAHHHLPSPSGTLCMHARMRSESGRISTFGCVHLSLPATLEDFFTTNQP